VHGFQSLNPLKLKTSQSDLLRLHIVKTNVQLVPLTLLIVYLVMSIDLITHFAHVMMDSMTQMKKFVNHVVPDIAIEQSLLITVPNVMESEHQSTNAHAQLDIGKPTNNPHVILAQENVSNVLTMIIALFVMHHTI